jgi:glucan phosphoethanolaminetransferase (alkaline phosphatase superfamily)
MIQRIQSLFLGGAFLAMMAFIFLPFAKYSGDLYLFEQYAYGFNDLTKGEIDIFGTLFPFPALLLAVFSIILTVVTIAQFKNRVFQMKLVKTNIIFMILLMVGVFFLYPYIINANIQGTNTFELGAYFPVITFVFLVLSYNFIQKDENLVKSLDRLR